MKRGVIVLAVCLYLVVACAPVTAPTPGRTPTMAPLSTAEPVVATPPPGPLMALQAYMRLVHERVLVEFARRIAANRNLLSAASSRSFDADALCPGPESGSWRQFDDLALDLSVMVVPPLAEGFHAALADALSAASRSAESYEWFCTTYASFGQPADGMWRRLSTQVRSCESRLTELRQQWAALGGDQMGLVW